MNFLFLNYKNNFRFLKLFCTRHLVLWANAIKRNSDCKWTRTQNHLVRKRTLNHSLNNHIQSNVPYRYVLRAQLNHLASLAKWLSVRLWTKWFWVQVQLQSLKLQISCLLWARSSLTFRQLECEFTLKRVCDMTRTYNQMHPIDKYSKHSPIIWPVRLNGWMFIYKLSGSGIMFSCSHLNFRFNTCFKEFLDIQATIECWFTLKCICDMTRTYSQKKWWLWWCKML